MRIRLIVAILVGLLVGAAAGKIPTVEEIGWVGILLAGYSVANLVFSVPILLQWLPFDAAATKDRVAGEDPGPAITDLVGDGAAIMSLLGVGILVGSDKIPLGVQLSAAVLAVAAVATGWISVHTLYALRYTRLYYATDVLDIDFNNSAEPPFSDFAYFSFNLGMTYQVSDTSTKTAAVRRVVLGHCVFSWVYGVVIIASVINLVVGIG